MLKESRGQSLTEFALLLPILLLLMLGVVDVARAYAAYVTITNAAREGARYGMENPTDSSGIQAHVNQEAGPGFTLTINITCPGYASCGSAYNGDPITVQVDYTYNFVTTYLFGVGSLTISNSATMAITNGLTP